MRKLLKGIIGVIGVVGMMGIAGCDSKLCYCYERAADGTVLESQVYTNTDTPCSSMSNDRRGCIERNERGTFNPEDIAK